MANIIPDPKKEKKERINKWWWRKEVEHDARLICATCGMTFNVQTDTSKPCPFCEMSNKAPRVKPNENWAEDK